MLLPSWFPSGSAQPAGTRGSFIATLDVLVVQSRHAPIATKSVTIAELAEQQWILNPQGCGYRAALQRAMEGVGKQVRLGVDMHGTETQLRLVAAGLGLGLAPTRLLANSHFLEDLCPVEVADFALKLDLWLLHAPELGNLSRALDVLGQVLVRTFEVGSAFARRRGWPRGTTSCCKQDGKRARQAQMTLGRWEEVPLDHLQPSGLHLLATAHRQCLRLGLHPDETSGGHRVACRARFLRGNVSTKVAWAFVSSNSPP